MTDNDKRLYVDACIPLSLIFSQYPQFPKCQKLMGDVQKKGIHCFIIKPVKSDIESVFNTSVNSAKNVLRRLMGHLPIAKGVAPREMLEKTTVKSIDIAIIEHFFETEYHNAGQDQIAKDLITSIESWVIQRLEKKLASENEVLLINFLVDLNKEQIDFYSKWDTQKLIIENKLNCKEDATDYNQEDLTIVKNLRIPGKVLDKDKQALATLYRIVKNNNTKIVYASTDYSIVLAKSLIEPNLGFLVSDPLYAVQKL
jgi:hypothetical protein